MTKEIIIFDKTESALQSIVSDAVTFSLLALCIWFSWHMGGGWWTFFTAVMMICFVGAKAASVVSTRQTKINSKAEALAWANSLPSDR